jgi:hypothetical protein
MSSAGYIININNQSGSNHQYLLLGSVPQANSNNGQAYSNIWIRTDGTPSPHGSQQIKIPQQTFAMCGTMPKSLDNGTATQELDYAEVNITGTGGTIVQISITAGSPGFETPAASATTNVPNSFGINTSDWDVDRYRKQTTNCCKL